MRKGSCFVLSLFLLTSYVTSVGAESSNISVTIDGEKQTFEQSPIILNDFTLVPMREIFGLLGAEVKWDENVRRVIANKESTTIILDIGKKIAFINSKPVELDLEARIINGRTMVPLRFVSEALGAKVEWNATTRSINISKDASRIEIQSDEMVLSYQKAIEKALSHNYDLKNKLADIERSEEVRDNASHKLGNGDVDDINQTLLKGLAQANIGLESAKKQVELQKEGIEYKVKSLYNDILQKEKSKDLDELNVENARAKNRVVKIKVDTGIASNFELVQAENTLKEAVQKLEVTQKELTQAYEKFNQVLNLPINSRPVLSDIPSFGKLLETDVDFHVKKVISDSTAVWLAEQQVQLAELNVNLYSFNSNFENAPYAAKEIDVKKAQISAASTKEQLEDATRTIYNSITKLENQYGLLDANLVKAQEGLKVLQAKYDLGMATTNELLEAKVSVEQVKQQMFSLVIQLDNLKMAYEKPWVMGM